MKTLLLVMSICAVLLIGCEKKDQGMAKEIRERQNDELVKDVSKVNSDLEQIRTKEIKAGDTESLNKISATLKESRDKIADLESRINSARRGDIAIRKSGNSATLTQSGERLSQSERMSEGHFKMKLEGLVRGLAVDNSPGQLSAAKSVRELQALYPDRDYSRLIIPLMRVVKNENANAPVRIVAARALHNVNSDRGNYAIKGVARESDNQSVRKVCALLSTDRSKMNASARLEQELDKEEAIATR